MQLIHNYSFPPLARRYLGINSFGNAAAENAAFLRTKSYVIKFNPLSGAKNPGKASPKKGGRKKHLRRAGSSQPPSRYHTSYCRIVLMTELEREKKGR